MNDSLLERARQLLAEGSLVEAWMALEAAAKDFKRLHGMLTGILVERLEEAETQGQAPQTPAGDYLVARRQSPGWQLRVPPEKLLEEVLKAAEGDFERAAAALASQPWKVGTLRELFGAGPAELGDFLEKKPATKKAELRKRPAVVPENLYRKKGGSK